MLRSIVFLVTFELIFGVLQAGKVQQRIRYGKDAEDLSVLLLQQTKNGLVTACTATLITPQIILTAAHCFEERPTRTTVTYGCSDLRSKRCKKMEVVSRTIHPKYVNLGKTHDSMGRIRNDIAVAKLARPIRDIKPKNLLGPGQAPPRGYVTLIGWGLTEKGKETDVLQSTTLQILDRPPFFVTEDKIIVDENNGPSGVEEGDSGGPLLIGDTVIGVASGSAKSTKNGWLVSTEKRYAVYMSVQYYSDFIQKAMKKYAGR